jgi:hypothetical protein
MERKVLLTSDLVSRPGAWPAHHQNPSARQFILGDLPRELQIKPETPTFQTGRIIEKVNHIPSKSISQATAFIKIERTRRIHSQIAGLAQGGA